MTTPTPEWAVQAANSPEARMLFTCDGVGSDRKRAIFLELVARHAPQAKDCKEQQIGRVEAARQAMVFIKSFAGQRAQTEYGEVHCNYHWIIEQLSAAIHDIDRAAMQPKEPTP